MVRTAWKKVVIIDTSAAIAILDEKDAFHKVALDYYNARNTKRWAVLNATAHETFTRARYDFNFKAASKAYGFLTRTTFEHLRFKIEDEKEAERILEKYQEHAFSFHDALCAAFMLRVGIYRIFTFDKDFWILGFQVEPGFIPIVNK